MTKATKVHAKFPSVAPGAPGAPGLTPATGARGRMLSNLRGDATLRRVLCIALLLGAEAAFLIFNVHARSTTYAKDFGFLGVALQPVTYFFIALGFLLTAHIGPVWSGARAHLPGHYWQRYLLPQFAAFIVVAGAAGLLMPTDYMAFPDLVGVQRTMASVLLAGSILGLVAVSMLLLAPVRYWRHFVRSEAVPIALALSFAIGAYLFGLLSQQSWNVLNKPTMLLTGFLLGLVYPNVVLDLPNVLLGTPAFVAIIAPECSGYEGIGLITAFLLWYLLSFRGELRMPNALLLFPLGACLIWLFNCVRVAVLIGIGSSFSPEIALQGFHSNGGWISFIAVSAAMIWLARRIPFFAVAAAPRIWEIDDTRAAIVPFLVLLGSTLLTQAMSAGFVWSYPARVVLAGLAIALLWKHLPIRTIAPDRFSVVTGLLVFAVWLFLVPGDPHKNALFGQELLSVPAWIAAAWVLVRVLGAVVIVPVAEELAFREYMLEFFRKSEAGGNRTARFHWTGAVMTSVLFGALHSAWLAGIVAGVAYYIVRVRRGRVMDAVVAHATTNFCLSVYVLMFSQWSLW